MTDPVENQPQSLQNCQDGTMLAGDEDPLLRQSQAVDSFIHSLRMHAYRKFLLPHVEAARRTLDGHTAAETIQTMLDDDEAIQRGTERIVYEVFDHEINNLVSIMRHTLFLSARPAIPEEQWGASETVERAHFERVLSEDWELTREKLTQLKRALQLLHGKNDNSINVEDVIDESIQSAYVGIYIDKDMLYPHHLVDVNTVRTISKSMQNVKRLLLSTPDERAALFTEMSTSKVRIGDFIDIFPDRHMYVLSGNIDRELNQFEINLFFEMLHNAKKYKSDPTEPIEICIDNTGQIDVKNRSKQKMDTHLTAFGTRGDESMEQNGNGFGIFKMEAIAGMTGGAMEFTSESLSETEPPLFVITCSLRHAA